MAGIAWCGGRDLPRVVTGARRPSRPRKSRRLLARANACRAPLSGEADLGRERKAHATLSIRRGCGEKTLCDQWMSDTRRGRWGPRRTWCRRPMSKIFDTCRPAVTRACLAGPTAPAVASPRLLPAAASLMGSMRPSQDVPGCTAYGHQLSRKLLRSIATITRSRSACRSGPRM
jgi:hypothetical protein